jgi:hypothetical protein
MSKYKIGEVGFKTKKESYEYTRDLLNTLGVGRIITTTDYYYSYFIGLLSNHYDKESKEGVGIKNFMIVENPVDNRKKHLEIVRIDNTTTSFSWVKCSKFNSKVDSKLDLEMALRNAVHHHTFDYRKRTKDKCRICKVSGKEVEYQVDHKKKPFSKIKQDFLKTIDYDLQQDIYSDKKRLPQLKDSEYKQQWIEYHNSIAKYQILCRKCNIKKSNNI